MAGTLLRLFAGDCEVSRQLYGNDTTAILEGLKWANKHNGMSPDDHGLPCEFYWYEISEER